MSKMHPGEFPIDLFLVRRLVDVQFPLWAGLPLRPIPSVGTDNALYLLGDDKVVRLPRIGWAVADVDKEYEWLPKLAPFLPVAVPLPLAKGAPSEEYPRSWWVYRWLEGINPIPGHLSDPALLCRDLAAVILAFRRISLKNGPLSNRGGPLRGRDPETRKAIGELKGEIDIATVASIWEAVLDVPDESQLVWIHGDLSPGNILIQNGKLAGVIDFGNVGMGDPACDLIIAWNLLPAEERTFFRSLFPVDEAAWLRGRGWALSNALIALPYYKNTNPPLAESARMVIGEAIREAFLEKT